MGMQPWALSLPDKELCLREAEGLEPIPMDRGAWLAAVHVVAKSHLCQATRAPRAAFPSGCLAAQTKRWAEGIRVPDRKSVVEGKGHTKED